jgi:phospholipid-binding lipoprotein MlaA
LLGSFTVRDGFGAYGDAITTDVVGQIDHVRTRNSIRAVNLVDKRASLFAAEKLISGDRYTFIRDAYLQRREFLVKDGAVEDSFGEDDFDDDW